MALPLASDNLIKVVRALGETLLSRYVPGQGGFLLNTAFLPAVLNAIDALHVSTTERNQLVNQLTLSPLEYLLSLRQAENLTPTDRPGNQRDGDRPDQRDSDRCDGNTDIVRANVANGVGETDAPVDGAPCDVEPTAKRARTGPDRAVPPPESDQMFIDASRNWPCVSTHAAPWRLPMPGVTDPEQLVRARLAEDGRRRHGGVHVFVWQPGTYGYEDLIRDCGGGDGSVVIDMWQTIERYTRWSAFWPANAAVLVLQSVKDVASMAFRVVGYGRTVGGPKLIKSGERLTDRYARLEAPKNHRLVVELRLQVIDVRFKFKGSSIAELLWNLGADVESPPLRLGQVARPYYGSYRLGGPKYRWRE